jgi:hypothetical protein
MQSSTEIAVCLFDTPEATRETIGALKDAGFPASEISLLMPDPGQTDRMAEQTGTTSVAGTATRVIAGGILGGLAGWLVGIGAFTIPGIGPVVAAGALAAPITAAAVGAGVGALAGALIDVGLPEKDAKHYAEEVQRGRNLVVVREPARAAEADRLMHAHGGYDVPHGDTAPTTPAR